jgi:DNA-binding transcriptional ArsR family regulator
MNKQPEIIWEKGTAYDFFVSLYVLHKPENFGLRPSWAAGVRSRLPMNMREVLECSQSFMLVPSNFIFHLTPPKNAATALDALEALAPEDRLPALVFSSRAEERDLNFHEFLLSLDGKQRLTAYIENEIKEYYGYLNWHSRSFSRALFEAWSNRKEFGENLFQALKVYANVFYEEEEPRIVPAQEKALEEAQALAQTKDLLPLLEELSEGVRLDWIADVSRVVLAPTFWGTPFVFFDKVDDETGLVLFGARPKGTTLVPGELVPEELLNSLKAMADPTRLRILHYMLEGPCTTSELSRILRLRPPTINHHLNNLRLAGLIHVNISPQVERLYSIRSEGIDATIALLKDYLPGE